MAAAAALLLPLGLVACSEDSAPEEEQADTTSRPASVALGATGAGEAAGSDDDSDDGAAAIPSATLGLVVTLRSRAGEGSDHRFGAAGAQLAAYRLSLGAAEIDLEVVDDRGTGRGAMRAVDELVESGVAGIVVASQGDHLTEALEEASDAGVPVLLPYARPQQTPPGVWVTGPSAGAVDAALLAALRTDGRSRPFVITADGVEVDGVGSADATPYRPGRAGELVDTVVEALDSGSVDSVVVAASAQTQADLVTRFVGADSNVPLYLSPEALTGALPRALVEESGTLVGGLVSVGPDASDTTTLQRGPAGESAAAYFAALRLAAQESDLTGLLGAGEFASGDADTASHDAVVALARAVQTAGAGEPDLVAVALEGLVLDGDDGLAGPGLDFSDNQALADDAVVTLIATTQDPGVRPTRADDVPRLYWFAAEGDPAVGG